MVHSKQRARQTYFQAVLQSGNSPAKIPTCLAKDCQVPSQNERFWGDLIAEKGSGELVFNCAIFPQIVEGNKCLEIFLTPVFCECLSENGISLKIQGWHGYSHPMS
jgi:hypothetical protein